MSLPVNRVKSRWWDEGWWAWPGKTLFLGVALVHADGDRMVGRRESPGCRVEIDRGGVGLHCDHGRAAVTATTRKRFAEEGGGQVVRRLGALQSAGTGC